MSYGNIFSVSMAPGLASSVCFAFERSCSFAESWNSRFEDLRRGFEMLGGKAKPKNMCVSFQQALVPNQTQPVVSLAEQKRGR